MKITQQCSECGGKEIYAALSDLGGNVSTLLPGVEGLLSFAQIEVYVCGNCGYHQMFIGPKTLEKVKKKYTRYV